MTGLETNVFPITNLADLSASYRLYHVRGLGSDQAEFFQNRDALVRFLSFRLNSPVTVVEPQWPDPPGPPQRCGPASVAGSARSRDRLP